MGKHDRQKASDVFANTTFLFATKGSFSEAFPTIEEARVEVEETDFGQPLRTHHGNSKHGSISEFVNCSNSLCYNGGISVGDVLRHMVREQLTEYESRSSCRGYEGSPKGRKKYRDCLHGFRVKAWIKYKTPPPPSEPQHKNDENQS